MTTSLQIHDVGKKGWFPFVLKYSSLFVVLLTLGTFITLILGSSDTLKEFGISFFSSKEWDPIFGKFGALPFVAGTLITSILALILSIPFSISIAIFLGEYFPHGIISQIFTSLVELLAGIPSVIYGFWAMFYLVPIVRSIETSFDIMPYGVGILTASLILSVMIIPFSASISREVIRMVPSGLKEGAYSLGATRFEVIKDIVLPYCKSGIFAGVILALGRALGETMAVTMVIGNMNVMPENLFAPGNTLASVIANEFAEATDDRYISALVELGLVLFVVTIFINLLGRFVIRKLSRNS